MPGWSSSSGSTRGSSTARQLPADARSFGIVTIDVSFISLRLVLPVVPPLLDAGGDVVALVKPQFEAGRTEIGKGGIVRDDARAARAWWRKWRRRQLR